MAIKKKTLHCLYKIIVQTFSIDNVMIRYLPQRGEDKHVTKVSVNMASQFSCNHLPMPTFLNFSLPVSLCLLCILLQRCNPIQQHYSPSMS